MVMVTMLFVLVSINWEGWAHGAKELTSSDPSEEAKLDVVEEKGEEQDEKC